MLRRCACLLILLLVIGMGAAGCAVLDAGQAAPGPGVSPLPLLSQGIPLAGVAPPVSPLPLPPSVPTAGAARPVSPLPAPTTVSPLPPPRAVSPLALPPVSPLPSPKPPGQVALGAAPDFSLQRENGQTLRLSDARGKNVVLVFYRGQT